MLSFNNFVNNKRKYVAINTTEECSRKLKNFCEQFGFDLTKNYNQKEIHPEEFDFHTTIIYSSNVPSSPIPNGLNKINTIHLQVKGIDLFGPEKNIPVLLLIPSNELLEVRNYICKKHGLEDKWPEYKPHLSLSYNYSGNLDCNIWKKIDFLISYDTLVVEDIAEINT